MKLHLNISKLGLRTKLAILGVVAFFWFWGTIAEPYFITKIDSIKLSVPNWNPKLDGLKIGVLGDIHGKITPFEDFRISSRIELLESLNPDIIILTGDYLDGSNCKMAMDENQLAQVLSKIKAPYGVYAIMGNHDSYYSRSKIRKLLRKAGIDIIENSNRKISTPRGDFYLAGIADPVTSSYSYKSAFKNIPSGAPIVFLTHAPDVLREIPKAASFSISGHTHGGQIVFPFVGPIITHSMHGRDCSSGLISLNDKIMYVNSGIGMSRIPVRFFCPPTIGIIEVFQGNPQKSEPAIKTIKGIAN